jgi:hypothetical protein
MGRDGTKILQNRPIPWDEKFLEVFHPVMGRNFEICPTPWDEIFLEVSHPMMG